MAAPRVTRRGDQRGKVLGKVIRYEVVYVGDDDLPGAQPWAIVRTGAETFLFVKESVVDAETLTRIWCSWQHANGNEAATRRPERAYV